MTSGTRQRVMMILGRIVSSLGLVVARQPEVGQEEAEVGPGVEVAGVVVQEEVAEGVLP